MADGLDDILTAFGGLMESHEAQVPASEEGTGNFRCEHCVACHECRFCTECDNCRECTYCYACRDCLSLTQCRECDACENLSHSDLCGECSGGSHLTLCLDCEDCVQCFACVGLVAEEFCILNEKLTRKEYFAKVKELRSELDQRVRVGWRPPWLESEDVPEPDEHTQSIQVEPLPVSAPEHVPRLPAPQDTSAEPRSATPPPPPSVDPHPEDSSWDGHFPPLTRLTEEAPPPDDDSWRQQAGPPLVGELPQPESKSAAVVAPVETDDSGVWAAQMFDDFPPPPPYTGDIKPTSPPEPPADAGPERPYVPLDEQPTLTRGARPTPRRKPAAPKRQANRVSLRRAKRPERQ